jgi:hypothetical protein
MWYRHVDDNLIISNAQKTNIVNTLDEFNAMHPKLKFSMEQHPHLAIRKTRNELRFGIYRKSSATDLILHNTSCHPYEYKIQPSITHLTVSLHMNSPKKLKTKNKKIVEILRNE